MSNQIYPKAAEKILSGVIDFSADTFGCAILPQATSFNSAHEFLGQLGTTLASAQMSNTSVSNGAFDADDVNFGTVEAGKVMAGLLIYKDTGDPATSPVIFYYDNIQGFPMTATGGPVLMPWNNDDNKIAKIAGQFFPQGASAVLKGHIHFLTDDLKVALLPTSYQYNASHATVADIGGSSNFVGVPQSMTNKSISNGVFNASAIDFGLIPAGKKVGRVVVYKDGGSDADSILLLNVDGLYGVPFDTNGAQVTLQWATDSAKIFSLSVY